MDRPKPLIPRIETRCQDKINKREDDKKKNYTYEKVQTKKDVTRNNVYVKKVFFLFNERCKLSCKDKGCVSRRKATNMSNTWCRITLVLLDDFWVVQDRKKLHAQKSSDRVELDTSCQDG